MAPEQDACTSAPHLTLGPANLTAVTLAVTGESIKVDAEAITSDMVESQQDPGSSLNQRSRHTLSNSTALPRSAELLHSPIINDDWRIQLGYSIKDAGLIKVANEKLPPTLSDIRNSMPNSPERHIVSVHETILDRCWK